MTSTENIVVNNFMFCAAHGDEYCYACRCDHRMTNNVQIEEDLGDVTELFEFEVEERQPLNAYALGAEAAIQTEDSYQCERHKKIDCGVCFNWTEIVRKAAKSAEDSGYGRWLQSGSEGVVVASSH